MRRSGFGPIAKRLSMSKVKRAQGPNTPSSRHNTTKDHPINAPSSSANPANKGGLGDGIVERVRSIIRKPFHSDVLANYRALSISSTQSPAPSKRRESTSTSSNDYYKPHISYTEAQRGLQDGTYVQGIVRINKKKRTEAYVTVDLKEDYILPTELLRNRALDGDLAVLKVIKDDPPPESLSGPEPRPGIEPQNAPYSQDDISVPQVVPKITKTQAEVVHILERRPVNFIPGFVRPANWSWGKPILTNTQIPTDKVLFVPQDNKLPFMVIRKDSLGPFKDAKDLLGRIKAKENVIFTAKVVAWSEAKFPLGKITGELGLMGDIDAETKAILAECDVDESEFPAVVRRELPKTPWTITAKDLQGRRDFREELVYTIDPETARDLDDAVSLKVLPEGGYEIGVHIADVSHFVKPGSKIDDIAQHRATTVYMVQKAIPMLPRLLCEELCSLNPGQDRLTFSVVWKMDKDGNEIGPRFFGKSVIRPAVRFSYGEAQKVIDGQPFDKAMPRGVQGPFTPKQIKASLERLLHISKTLERRRTEGGALSITSFQLKFSLDEHNQPKEAQEYVWHDTNRLIQEFMLYANVSVAQEISRVFPEHAVLRRHPPPKERPMAAFIDYALKLGVNIDPTSSKSLQHSFSKLSLQAEQDSSFKILQNNAVKAMNRAAYFCTGIHPDPASWRHYALAFSHYTHFTSPIRRYADVLVHRLLERAIDQQKPGYEPYQLEMFTKNCNLRKENSRVAQERSSMLYLAAYIEDTCKRRNRTGFDEGMETDATVVDINDSSIDVVIPQYGLERRILLDHSLSVHHTDLSQDSKGDAVLHIQFKTKEQRRRAISEREEADSDEESVRKGTKKVADKAMGIRKDLTIRPLSHLKVFLRGDFSRSPCEITAGVVWLTPPDAEPVEKT